MFSGGKIKTGLKVNEEGEAVKSKIPCVRKRK